MKANTDIQFKNYSLYQCPGNETNGVFHGGVATLVNNSFTQKNISINTRAVERLICLIALIARLIILIAR